MVVSVRACIIALCVMFSIPFFTDVEYERFRDVSFITSVLGCISSSILLLIWLLDPSRRSQYLVISFVGVALLYSIMIITLNLVPFEKYHCASNAVALEAVDGFNLCAVASFLYAYLDYALTIAWMLQAAELYWTVVLGKRIGGRFYRHMLLIYVAPLIPCFVMGLVQMWGYSGTNITCLVSRTKAGVDILVIYFPLLAMLILGMTLMIRVFAFLIWTRHRQAQIRSIQQKQPETVIGVPVLSASTSYASYFLFSRKVSSINSANGSSAEGSNSLTISKLLAPLIFVAVFLVIFAINSIYRGILYEQTGAATQSAREWASCIFKHFHGDNAEWRDVCGSHPSQRPDFNAAMAYFVINGGQALIASFIYLSNPSLWMPLVYVLWGVTRCVYYVIHDSLVRLKTSVARFTSMKQQSGGVVAPEIPHDANGAVMVDMNLDQNVDEVLITPVEAATSPSPRKRLVHVTNASVERNQVGSIHGSLHQDIHSQFVGSYSSISNQEVEFPMNIVMYQPVAVEDGTVKLL